MCIFCNLTGVESGGLGCRDLPNPVDPGAGDHNTAPAQANAADGGTGAPPAFSLAQIIQQLRTQWGGAYEGTTESWPGTGAINYYIGGGPYSTAEEGAYKVNMTALMQTRATLAFELWDDLIARDLNQASTAAFGQIQFEYASRTYNASNVLATNGGTYSRSWFSANGTNAYGTANYGTTRDEIWLNSNWTSHDQDGDMFFGGYGFQTYMHEIGHSLGLSHPGTYNAGSGSITYANNAEYSLDNRQYTIMSYFGGYQPGSGWQQDGTLSNWLYSSTPMLHDVAAIQAIYGADTATRTGDTTYGFHSNAGRDVFDFTIDTSPIVTVWDAGGTDTLDLSGYSANQRIDLRAGTYSDVGGMLSNFAIAFNVTIENAVGGSGNDTITGNDANNVLQGGGGNDAIDGGNGIDSAVFSGVRSAYTLTALGGTSVRVSGPDGTDTLTNVERLVFSDQTVTWPPVNQPDLDAVNLALGSAAIMPNGSTTVSYTVSNLGGVTAAASTVGIYLSNDGTFDGSDTLLTTRSTPSLAAGGSFNDSFTLTLSTLGTFFIFAVADYNNVITTELDEGNNPSNAARIAVAVPLNLTGTSGPDTLTSGPFDDTIDGGAGDDTAVFSQSLANYSPVDLGSRITISGPDGNDTLFGIEHLRFADGTINVNDGSGLFDTVFYDRTNIDVFHAMDARSHYNSFGWHEGRDPNAFFSTSGYLAANSDVRAAGVNPLDHYHNSGWREGKDPGPNFDTTLYLLRNPDVAAAGVDPLEHYLQHGRSEGRIAYEAIGSNIVVGFDAEYYLFHNPDVAKAGVDALTHYNNSGWHEGRTPNAYFDTAGYLAHNPDVAAAGVNPLQHYMYSGWHEGRDPSTQFDTHGYLTANPDVAAAHINPLDHFLHSGIYEGRLAVNDGLWG